MAEMKTIPITEERETDVFVAGAGTAGCMAAIAAARAGARVVLIERLPVPGGTLTNGGIGVSSYFSQDEDPAKGVRIVGGLSWELITRLQEMGGATDFAPTPGSAQHNTWRVVADHEPYKGLISRMLLDAGVTVLLNAILCGAEVEEGILRSVLVQTRAGLRRYRAQAFIDATGDGDLARQAGAEQIDMSGGKECPTGMVFGMNGIDWARAEAENPTVIHRLVDDETNAKGLHCRQYAFVPGVDPSYAEKLPSLKGVFFISLQSNHDGEATYINISEGERIDATDPDVLSAAELRMRARINDIADDLRGGVKGFEKAWVSWASVQLGVRISKITRCDYSVTQDDIFAARRFEDEIGLYGFHDLSNRYGDNILTPPPGFYGFPYRMLLPKGLENLYMAGRCVTEQYEAHMSTRNTVGCLVMGQAAGAAAALCAARGVLSRDLPYPVLREELLRQDVLLDPA